MCLRKCPVAGCCEEHNEPNLGLHTGQCISWPAEQRSACEDGLCSIDLLVSVLLIYYVLI
jgi:hypothetical protein